MKSVKPMVLLLGLALAGAPATILYAQPPQGQWEPQEPQGNWSQVWHQGFHEGVEAARHDLDAGRPPDPHRHANFRHPHVPPDQRDDFRRGFERGYHMVFEHHDHPGM